MLSLTDTFKGGQEQKHRAFVLDTALGGMASIRATSCRNWKDPSASSHAEGQIEQQGDRLYRFQS